MWQPCQTIHDLLRRNVEDFPDREALVSVSYKTGNRVRHTWTEIDEISDRVATGLAHLGVQKGQKIGFMLTNSAECYYTYLAIHKIGAVFVPINVRLVPREIKYIVENADADFIVAGVEFFPLVNLIRERLSVKAFVGIDKKGESVPDWATPYSELVETEPIPPTVTINPEDMADILYTSGTTGLPKGVVLTQRNKVACGRLLGTAMGFSRLHYGEHRLQTAFPFFTSSGCSSMMMIWLYFAMVMILEETFDVIKALESLERERSSYYCGAPSMFIFLLNHPRFKEFDTSSVRCLLCGAAAMPEELIRQLQATWPGVLIYYAYALTEGGTGGTMVNPAESLTRLGSIGQPWAPDQEARIVDEQDRDVKPGEVGEIVLKGPNIMKEYYKNPKATAETLRNGWLHTGDMGYCNEQGYFYYTDRAKDMIVRGGFNVYSIEVENAIYEHSAVKQCAVVGKPHPKLGEDIVAFVVLKDGETVTAEELQQFTEDKLADYKRPRDIRFIEAVPVNPTGKVDKKLIRSQYIKVQS